MPDPSKTEAATPKRKKEAREGGQIARSQEINTVLILLFALIVLKMVSLTFFFSFEKLFTYYLGHLGEFHWTPARVLFDLRKLAAQMLILISPLFLAVIVAGLAAGFAQAGFFITFKPLMPKFSKLNPITGLGRIFSKQGFAELLRSTIKIFAVGFVAYLTLKQHFPQLLFLEEMGLKQGLFMTAGIVYQLIFRVLMAAALIAVLDFLYQKFQFEQNLKMTKEEVKEELKQAEGDPRTRSRIRAKQRQMGMRRMMQSVPEAVVVITNPVHLAIALKYTEEMPAPIVLAKGAGFVAEKIKEIAKEKDILIIEKPPLARMLFKVDIGKYIPSQLYQAVAEIVAYIYQIKPGLLNSKD